MPVFYTTSKPGRATGSSSIGRKPTATPVRPFHLERGTQTLNVNICANYARTALKFSTNIVSILCIACGNFHSDPFIIAGAAASTKSILRQW